MLLHLKLKKISLNEWYAGNHWGKRKHIKDMYIRDIHSQLGDGQFPSDWKYEVIYDFIFSSRPLDASNCIAMVKLIEDILFEDDSYKIVKRISISSTKGNEDIVHITINRENDDDKSGDGKV